MERSVNSADGTCIGYQELGSGPAIVFVHGSLGVGDEWLQVAHLLGDRFTCYLMDRRGRGRSGDARRYSLDTECADIAAVLDAAGPSPALLGHSYGAICALEAARRVRVSKLILYEPPFPIDGPTVGDAFERYRAAVANNQLDEALLIGARDLVKLTDAQVAEFRASPAWQPMAALTPTWVRELEAIKSLPLGVERFGDMSVPTLLLLGTATARHHEAAVAALAKTLVSARTSLLLDQGHQAHLLAPTVVAGEIASFLRS
jgi:pimeloyl-ACP methyl ester carboxylesterase